MLFLADEAHRNCAKAKLTRRHPPMGRRADCLVKIVKISRWTKRNGGSENKSRHFMGA